jgi:hypothetical protein
VVRSFEREEWRPTAEIRAARFFPITALPEGTSGGTARRIAEIVEGRRGEARW